MSKEQDILKSLLLKDELELLDKISQKVLSKEQFTEEVSEVLSNAIIRAQEKNGRLQRTLAKPIEKGVKRAFVNNKQSIIDSLLPIMGQLIRKTVSNSIKQFVTDINRTLELGFSAKAIKWRWQAFKTGSTFAEIVFQKTVRYQVTEMFLVNRNNGLLIEHIGIDDMLKDNNAISAMLTAIQDFIGDSLKSSDSDSLTSAEIGGNSFLITAGPTAFLATVVKGSPSEKLKERLQQLIENVHAEFSTSLSDENTYRNINGLTDYLRPYLVTKNVNESEKKTNWWPWIIIILALLGSLIYWTYQRNQEYKNIQDISNQIAGLAVHKIERKNGHYEITGLIDPMADVSILNNENIILKTKPYISLDHDIISKRVEKILKDYPGVKTEVKDQKLTITGELSIDLQHQLLAKLDNIMGIIHINNQMQVDRNSQIQAYLQQTNHMPKTLNHQISNSQLTLSGYSDYESMENLMTNIKEKFPWISIHNENVNITDDSPLLIAKINQTQINLTDYDFDDYDSIKNNTAFQDVIKNLHLLSRRNVKITLSIIGNSDCYGRKSDEYSLKRAQFIQQALINNGINPTSTSTEINSCSSFEKKQQTDQLHVIFVVK